MPETKDDRRIRFTKPTLAALPTPEKGRVYYYDERTSGLAICVTHTGSKSFYLYKKVNGQPMRLRLGAFPEITVEQARKNAAKALADIADGKNPHEEKRNKQQKKQGEWTLGNLFQWFLDEHAKVHKKTWEEDERQWNRYLKSWENRKLSTITLQDVKKHHAKIGTDNGKYAANRMLALLSSMYSQAQSAELWDGQNPASGIKKFREHSRDRFMQADELPKFFKAVEDEPNALLRDYFLLLLLTGARRSNVMAMRWDELNLEQAQWKIPETKNGDGITIHLSADAVRILTERKSNAEHGNPWVFPSNRKNAKCPHLSEPAKAWKRICDRAELKDIRIHDLRRTLGSWQAATGASLPVIGKTLGHRNQSTTQIYARLNLDPVRQSVDVATAAMMALAKPKPEGNEQAECDNTQQDET